MSKVKTEQNNNITTGKKKKNENTQSLIITIIRRQNCFPYQLLTTTSYDSIRAIIPFSRSFSWRIVKCVFTPNTKLSTHWIYDHLYSLLRNTSTEIYVCMNTVNTENSHRAQNVYDEKRIERGVGGHERETEKKEWNDKLMLCRWNGYIDNEGKRRLLWNEFVFRPYSAELWWMNEWINECLKSNALWMAANMNYF